MLLTPSAKLDELYLRWWATPEAQSLAKALVDTTDQTQPTTTPSRPPTDQKQRSPPKLAPQNPESRALSAVPPILPPAVEAPPSKRAPSSAAPDGPSDVATADGDAAGSTSGSPSTAERNLKRGCPGLSLVSLLRPPVATASPCSELVVAQRELCLAPDAQLSRADVARLFQALPANPLPSYASGGVWRALVSDTGAEARLPSAALHDWFARRLAQLRPAEWLLCCISGGAADAGRDHLCDMLEDILAHHPGLEFLRQLPEFQQKYAETVVERILYTHDPLGGSKLRPEAMRDGRLSRALHSLDVGDAAVAINSEANYFSYEHFYVIFSTFCDLDIHQKGVLDVEDLQRYCNCALSCRAVERIFTCGRGAAASDGAKLGPMTYADFVWFLLSEVDKTSRTACGYWFRILDVDGDGYIDERDLQYFYEEQEQRQAQLNLEVIPFRDVLMQLTDAISPRGGRRGRFALSDLRRSRMCGLLAHAMCNINKFLLSEAHSLPSLSAGEDGERPETEWERWVAAEYVRLDSEDAAAELSAHGDGSLWMDFGAEGSGCGCAGLSYSASGAVEAPF